MIKNMGGSLTRLCRRDKQTYPIHCSEKKESSKTIKDSHVHEPISDRHINRVPIKYLTRYGGLDGDHFRYISCIRYFLMMKRKRRNQPNDHIVWEMFVRLVIPGEDDSSLPDDLPEFIREGICRGGVIGEDENIADGPYPWIDVHRTTAPAPPVFCSIID